MSITPGFDATAANFRFLPAGSQVAGYDTGTPDIKWTADMWSAFPDAVHIDQAPFVNDFTADAVDYESGTISLADLPAQCEDMLAAREANRRTGQRTPLVYASADNLTPVCNVLTDAKMANGSIGLYVANWNLTKNQASIDIGKASGPFPIRAIQFRSGLQYDFDVFSTEWLNNRSGFINPAPPLFTGVLAYIPPENDFELHNAVLRMVRSKDGGKTWA